MDLVIPKNKTIRFFFQILIITLLIVSICLIGLCLNKKPSATPTREVVINQQELNVLAASTPAQHYRGLSGRKDLTGLDGMIFIFSDSQVREFVMREMNFPLDIVFIQANKIIKIEENLVPEGRQPTKIYTSGAPCDLVLEVPAGQVKEFGWQVGQEARLN